MSAEQRWDATDRWTDIFGWQIYPIVLLPTTHSNKPCVTLMYRCSRNIP